MWREVKKFLEKSNFAFDYLRIWFAFLLLVRGWHVRVKTKYGRTAVSNRLLCFSFFGKKTQKMRRIFNVSPRNATLFKETA
jgi:hypothetical protein